MDPQQFLTWYHLAALLAFTVVAVPVFPSPRVRRWALGSVAWGVHLAALGVVVLGAVFFCRPAIVPVQVSEFVEPVAEWLESHISFGRDGFVWLPLTAATALAVLPVLAFVDYSRRLNRFTSLVETLHTELTKVSRGLELLPEFKEIASVLNRILPVGDGTSADQSAEKAGESSIGNDGKSADDEATGSTDVASSGSTTTALTADGGSGWQQELREWIRVVRNDPNALTPESIGLISKKVSDGAHGIPPRVSRLLDKLESHLVETRGTTTLSSFFKTQGLGDEAVGILGELDEYTAAV